MDNKEAIKVLLREEPIQIEYQHINSSHRDRLKILHTNTVFECFFLPSRSNTKKLYVCLTGHMGTDLKYPLFDRPTWYYEVDANFLCIDDPSKHENNHVVSTYWFGKKNENYIYYLIDIIEKFKCVHDIKNEDIIFISNSNGGFACMYCCFLMEYTSCIVFNPQFSVNSWLMHRNTGSVTHNIIFQNIFNLDFDDEKYADRLNLNYITSNKKSKFFIYVNMAGIYDKEQLDIFVKDKEFNKELIIQKLQDNIILYTPTITGRNPHVSFPFDYSSIFLFEHTLTKHEIDLYDYKLYEMLTNYLQHYYRIAMNYRNITKQIDEFLKNKLGIKEYNIKDFICEIDNYYNNYYNNIENEQIEYLKSLLYPTNRHDIKIIDSFHDDKTWCRVWNDGFCEQGGVVINDAGIPAGKDWIFEVKLQKSYHNCMYNVILTVTYPNFKNKNASCGEELNTFQKQQNSFHIFYHNRNEKQKVPSGCGVEWRATGFLF